MADLTAQSLIRTLGMKPHPEGGHYVETFRDPDPEGGRGAATAIYFLLQAGERSHWHKVDAVEIWHWYAGAPLRLAVSVDSGSTDLMTLGTDIAAGQRPQAVVPAHAWQSAESLGPWTLVGCTVSPAFQFEGFQLAAPGWRPGD